VVIPKISIPSAFSPNGDGKNDVLRALYGSDISQAWFYVYNRWGQLLFVDAGTHKSWDGSFADVMQPAGTYAWTFEYKDITGKMHVLKGTVALIR